jgi:hypothetical protein
MYQSKHQVELPDNLSVYTDPSTGIQQLMHKSVNQMLGMFAPEAITSEDIDELKDAHLHGIDRVIQTSMNEQEPVRITDHQFFQLLDQAQTQQEPSLKESTVVFNMTYKSLALDRQGIAKARLRVYSKPNGKCSPKYLQAV